MKNTYILDPGHGGINPQTGQYVTAGKRSPKWADGSIYYEGVGNREIVKIIAEKLKALGISYAFTVAPDNYKDVGLGIRVQASNLAHAKKPCVLISIHSNAASVEQANGYEVFTAPGQNTSDTYATICFKELAKEFPTLKGRSNLQDGDTDKEELFAVLKAKCPSFLVETMFHSNEKECRILMSKEGKEKIANAIVRTIQQIEKL